jgi:hypothetical protein
MTKENAIKLFQDQRVQVHWDEEDEKWFFSIVDVISLLTNSINPQAYWRKLKERLKKEGNETVTNCHGLKMIAADGKLRMTDVADTEQLLRLTQSIPSPTRREKYLKSANGKTYLKNRLNHLFDPAG